jgi:hypothetical protein
MVEQRGLLGNFGQNMQRGFGRLGDAITGKDLNARDQLAMTLMSLSGNPQQTQQLQQLAANRIQQRKQNDANNKTVAFIKNINPEIGALVEANPALAPTALQQIMRARMSGGADNSTALMKNFAFLRDQFPDMQPTDLLAKLQSGNTFNLGSNVQVKGDYVITEDANGNPVFTPLPGSAAADRLQKNETTETKIQDANLSKRSNKTNANRIIIENIDAAISQIEGNKILTTGYIGGKTNQTPGTPAFDVQQRIAPIVANIGFDRLDQMRQESPTGGALGQVAVQELKYLQAVKGSLEQGQTAGQLLGNLQSVKESYVDHQQRLYDAILEDQKNNLINKGTGEVIKPSDFFTQAEIDLLSSSSEEIQSPNTTSNITASDIRGLPFDALIDINVDNLDIDALEELNRRFTEGQ